jgi:hypothetical protein
MATFWVSFATEEKFLGVAIIDVDDETPTAEDVVRETIRLGCNPGDGAVQAQRIPDGKIPDSFKNRLLGKDEVAHLNAGGLAS